MYDHVLLWCFDDQASWEAQLSYSLVEKFWFIHYIHQTLHLQISIDFALDETFLMEKKKTSVL